jgi:hypothetical protein
MQPTYLPWSGYFNLIQAVDVFVFLDDVQFEHQSWQTRNAICVQGRRHQIVVPVARSPLATPIREIRVDPTSNWRKKHWGTLVSAYGRAPFGEDVLGFLAPYYESKSVELLSELNQQLVLGLCRLLGVSTRFVRSSDLGCEGSRSARLLNICGALGCASYLSPRGSAEYLADDRFEDNGRVVLEFQDYAPAPYAQHGAKQFISHLSVVDVVANLGWSEAMRYVKGVGSNGQ